MELPAFFTSPHNDIANEPKDSPGWTHFLLKFWITDHDWDFNRNWNIFTVPKSFWKLRGLEIHFIQQSNHPGYLSQGNRLNQRSGTSPHEEDTPWNWALCEQDQNVVEPFPLNLAVSNKTFLRCSSPETNFVHHFPSKNDGEHFILLNSSTCPHFNEIWPSFDETNASTMSSKLDETSAMITHPPISPVYILRMMNIKNDAIYIYLPSMYNDKVSKLSLPVSHTTE